MASLEYCLRSGHKVSAVITAPDKPKGRGLHLEPNPVRAKCLKEGLLTFAPSSLRDLEWVKKITALEPDLFVVASYGKLVPPSWLSLPRKAALNIHPSLLPKYRGAAPITWQILDGQKETGVSIAEVTPELDAGDIFCQLRTPLDEKETTATLSHRLSELAVKALEKVLKDLESGRLQRTRQKSEESSYARKLTKEDGELKFTEPAEILARKIRAFDPWPGTFIYYGDKPLRIVSGVPGERFGDKKAGTLLELDSGGALKIQTGKGTLNISKVQLAGRQAISGRDFANGQRLKPGFIFECR